MPRLLVLPTAAARVFALLLALASAGPASAAATKAFVFGTDYTTGSLSAWDLPARTPHCDVASPNSDATLRFFAGRLYVVNRFGGDNVQVVDPQTLATTFQFSVGNGSNPQDIAFASPTRAYVTRYESADLWIVNPQTGAHTGTISLAPYADADGIPEMGRLQMVGPLLFVAIQRVDRPGGYLATDTSYVAVVDTRADTLVDCDPALPGRQAIRLQLSNPVTTFQFDRASSRLLVGCVGDYGVKDGGIEWVDPVHLRSDGVAITEGALGGDVGDVVWKDAQESYAIVADTLSPVPNTTLVRWSPSAGTLLGTLWAPGGYSLADAELNDDGELWVCRSSFSGSALRAYDTATDTPIGSDLHCTLPPTAITFDAPSAQVADVAPAAPRFAFAPPWPNPVRGAARFELTLAAPGALALQVFDAAGRQVRTLAAGTVGAGPHAYAWDLHDDAGRRVPPGLYLARGAAGGEVLARRVVVIGR